MDNNRVYLCECWARDGLQSIPQFVPTADKIKMLNEFSNLGFARIEATSFSNPKVVPQFVDAVDVLRGLNRKPGVSYKATCVNEKALDRAVETVQEGFGPDEVSFTISASETHNLQNSKMSHAEHWGKLEKMVRKADDAKLHVVATIVTAFGCPWEGTVSPQKIWKFVERFEQLGVNSICLGDTTGSANPWQVKAMFNELIARHPRIRFIAHFHDTRGTGIANCIAAYESGVRYFDCSIGGVGGQIANAQRRYQPGNGGNVCSEDLICMLNEMGVETGIDSAALISCGKQAEAILNMELRSNVVRCGMVQH